MDDLSERLAACQKKISLIATETGRAGADLRLLAVSKTHPPESIAQLHALGVREFGENYAQELALKSEALQNQDIRFVFIGSLQSNKIPLIVRHAAEIQSVASLKHASLIAKEAAKIGKTPYPVYILVNAGDEASKSGVPLPEAISLAHAISRSCPDLSLEGIMAIPPPLDENRLTSPSPGLKVPALYRELRSLADQIGRGRLSLGMSDDLEEAIAAGSNCIRIGTALFGPRQMKKTP